MGFYHEISWANIPPIWKDIESSKTEADLRRILDREWSKNEKNVNVQFYKMYWLDNLLTVIRKVEFTKSGEATFLVLELKLSLPQLMP